MNSPNSTHPFILCIHWCCCFVTKTKKLSSILSLGQNYLCDLVDNLHARRVSCFVVYCPVLPLFYAPVLSFLSSSSSLSMRCSMRCPFNPPTHLISLQPTPQISCYHNVSSCNRLHYSVYFNSLQAEQNKMRIASANERQAKLLK